MLRSLGREQQRAIPDGMSSSCGDIWVPARMEKMAGPAARVQVAKAQYRNGCEESLPGPSTTATTQHMHKKQPPAPDHRPRLATPTYRTARARITCRYVVMSSVTEGNAEVLKISVLASEMG